MLEEIFSCSGNIQPHTITILFRKYSATHNNGPSLNKKVDSEALAKAISVGS
jgi:hypothetical protein